MSLNSSRDAVYTAELDSAVNNPRDLLLHGYIITREIDCCLVSCKQCTDAYVDNITGGILLIICRHHCHSTVRHKLAVST
jgi:hypothetical protein